MCFCTFLLAEKRDRKEKKVKKWGLFCIVFLLNAVMLISVVLMSSVHGADCAVVRVSHALAQPGDQQVEITLELSENPGICGMILRITYDPCLTLVCAEKGSALPSLTLANFSIPYLNPLIASWDGIHSDTSNGQILKLVFAVPEDTVQAEYAISVSYREGDVYDDDLCDLPLITEDGYIRVNSSADHTHTMIWVPQTAAACYIPGRAAHWSCTSCKKQFQDQQGNVEIDVSNGELDPSNHVGGTEVRNVRKATSENTGYTGDVYCLGCNCKIYSGQIIPRLSAETTEVQTEITQQPPNMSDESTEWNNPFTDVLPEDSFYAAVRFVNQKGLFQGVSKTEFAPDVTMTRAMFVTVLGRLAGVDVNLYKNVQFIDVKENEWYTPYVGWAKEKGIVEGYGNGYFGVHDTITIEQAGVILERYARFIRQDTSSDIALLHYDDADQVSYWAEDAMNWLVQRGIYEGKGLLLTPRAPASRARIAEFLHMFILKSVL